ncbi:MAG TPA: folylpolyglutamate synthase/dihydrofolate synthase family protein [Acidimicrobiales bacterium]|nr:folylpolyglutamate synthase/dihydrofolate synthase family protein [Acidimicrobiales bacterium]
MRLTSYADALTWLESHVDYERVAPNRQEIPTLQPVIDTLAMLAEPHHDYPAIHITGTNGKGSTTTLISALLSATGLRVGAFTSPDLHAVNERIAVNSEPIDDEEFIALIQRLSDVESVSGIALTRFELLTVAAFLHFSDEGVDVAVVEVGLGGTWDSTNVIDSVVAVLTNVDLDHTAVLGPTIGAIASDKVGIFRSDGVAIVGTTNAIVIEIAQRRVDELGADLWLIGETFELEQNELAVGGRAITLRTPFTRYDEVFVSLHGIHQGVNAATAIVAAEAFLGRALGDDIVTSTLAKARMPGRMELISRKPMIVVDGAHNPAGVKALVATLDGAFHVAGERRCVLGMLSGRDIDDMVEPLVTLGFTEFHCCAPHSTRAVSASEVANAIRRHGGVAFEHPSAIAALAHARERSTDEDLIVVAGSLYLVAEVRGEVMGVRSRHLT